MAAELTGWQDNPVQPGIVPEWVIIGIRDGEGCHVLATSVLEKAQYDKHFDGYETGPLVSGKPARTPMWRHILGFMFTRYSVVHAAGFEEALAKLPSVWSP